MIGMRKRESSNGLKVTLIKFFKLQVEKKTFIEEEIKFQKVKADWYKAFNHGSSATGHRVSDGGTKREGERKID